MGQTYQQALRYFNVYLILASMASSFGLPLIARAS